MDSLSLFTSLSQLVKNERLEVQLYIMILKLKNIDVPVEIKSSVKKSQNSSAAVYSSTKHPTMRIV